jgi:hypothetical protein
VDLNPQGGFDPFCLKIFVLHGVSPFSVVSHK